MLLGLFIFLVVIVNLFPVYSSWRWYEFTTKNGEFGFGIFEAKGRDVDMMNRAWEHYKLANKPTDTTLYRTFKINPIAFWEWRQYLFSKKYRFPYIDPDKVSKNPVDSIQASSNESTKVSGK